MYSGRRRNACRIRFRERIIACFAVVVFLAFLAGYYYSRIQSELQLQTASIRPTTEERTKADPCDLIHIGMVCVTHESKLKMYPMLQSLFHYRKSNPIQFYIVVHQKFKYSLSKLFETWALPDVNVKFYYLEDADPYAQFTDFPNMLRLMLPKRLKFKDLSKIILLSTDILFYSDIFELWNEFQYFSETQFLGIPTDKKYVEGKKRGFADVVLYDLDNLRKHGSNKVWKIFDEQQGFDYDENSQVLNHFAKSKLAYSLECSWNPMSNTDIDCIAQNKVVHQETIGRDDFVKLMKGFDGKVVQKRNYNCSALPKQKNLKRPITDKCSSFPESDIQQKPTLLYFLEYKYRPRDSDVVTLATQLSLDKFDLLEEIAMRWRGPMTITFYLTYEEFMECKDLIKTSFILKDRPNTGFHVVFKYGRYFHITYLRNVALNEVKTPYLFSIDIHETPMENLYTVLKNHLANMPNMTTKALVVPAFVSNNEWAEMPSTKQDVLEMLQLKKVSIAQEDSRPEGHSPTNYAKWINATKPYKVAWKNMYEPYVVVKSDVVRYDERFFAEGLDKVLHIMELEAQGYEFYVLPDTFVVHEVHRKSRDKNYKIFPAKYKICLKSIQKQVAQDLKDKYGRKFLLT